MSATNVITQVYNVVDYYYEWWNK